ncbi:hypothetical protein OJ997_23080 [Solirubrobacter phytolaccae]|uniref:Uncharacterized protein n=1 Tax=Solirubrobacter phytolaccae TaxID=1404360 RepID=A0A9X3SA31_9ACTN|nr:hypothetical protein [Solirubrobacter phytolaccae]MDA0183213.1 hypothetical protein [Solirubrobacter phytolaccae]
MPAYDLYGSEVHEMAELQRFVERALPVRFADRTSDYIGDYAGSGLPGNEHFQIRSSVDADGELVEPDFAQFRTLLYVSGTDRSRELQHALGDISGLQMLRHQVFD